MIKLKSYPDNQMELFWGLKQGVKLCCILFYEYVWLRSLRPDLYDEYDTNKITYENGIILCPECILENLK